MKSYYTIRNNFHDSYVRVLCEGHDSGEEVTISPSRSQLRRIRRELCGHDGCTCGGWRGTQATEDGRPLLIDDAALFASR